MATGEGKTPEGGQEAPNDPAEPKGAKAKQKPPKKGGGVPGWAVAVIVIVVIAVIAGIAVGVVMALSGGGEEEANQAPTIASLEADPDSLAPGEGSTVTCVADDSDGDTLTYSWTANGGTISGTGDEITWIAPPLAKGYIVEVTVDDGNGGTDDDSVAIVVGIVAPTPTPTPVPTPTPTTAPTPGEGSIDIKSSPAGATVYIDGINTGMITPIVATHIPEGNHVVKLEYIPNPPTGTYYDWRIGPVAVIGGETAYINWALDIAPVQSVTIQPDAAAGKDAYVFEGTPASNNGVATYVFTSGTAVGQLCRTYIQFDLSSITASSVVIDAKLGLSYESTGAASASPVGVYRVTGPWDEAVITWDNQPAVAANVIGTSSMPAAPTHDFVYWDVHDLVQGWISGIVANRGMMLRDIDETTFEGYEGFYSSAWGTLAETPTLTIQYYDPMP